MRNSITNFLSFVNIFTLICFYFFFPKTYGIFPFKFQDLLAIQTSFMQIHFVILTIILAVFGFFGFYFIKESVVHIAEKKSEEIAEKTAKETAEKEMSNIKNEFVELVEKYPKNRSPLGSPLHSASESGKTEEMKEVYKDE